MTVEMTPASHDATLPGKADRNPAIPEMNREPAFTAFAAMSATHATTLAMAIDRNAAMLPGNCANHCTNVSIAFGRSTVKNCTTPVTNPEMSPYSCAKPVIANATTSVMAANSLIAVPIAAANATPKRFAMNSSRGRAVWIAPKKSSKAGDSVSIAGSTRPLTLSPKVLTPELIALKTLSAASAAGFKLSLNTLSSLPTTSSTPANASRIGPCTASGKTSMSALRRWRATPGA